mmetsp:Transcript_18795/g.37996  ORF Transcript_18795/g.37996 Transcript_18795/m.37996 type:complete len:275 (+) Transcript_18795:193-1017(+)
MQQSERFMYFKHFSLLSQIPLPFSARRDSALSPILPNLNLSEATHGGSPVSFSAIDKIRGSTSTGGRCFLRRNPKPRNRGGKLPFLTPSANTFIPSASRSNMNRLLKLSKKQWDCATNSKWGICPETIPLNRQIRSSDRLSKPSGYQPPNMSLFNLPSFPDAKAVSNVAPPTAFVDIKLSSSRNGNPFSFSKTAAISGFIALCVRFRFRLQSSSRSEGRLSTCTACARRDKCESVRSKLLRDNSRRRGSCDTARLEKKDIFPSATGSSTPNGCC